MLVSRTAVRLPSTEFGRLFGGGTVRLSVPVSGSKAPPAVVRLVSWAYA